MKARAFLEQLHHDDLARAIRDAEEKTSGEIRVFITRQPVETPVAAAQQYFLELGMDKTRERNGVLIFVAPISQKFAVIGDVAIHNLCGDVFWQELAALLTGHFQNSDFTAGLLAAIQRAGDLLAKHFPRKPDDLNELPNEIVRD